MSGRQMFREALAGIGFITDSRPPRHRKRLASIQIRTRSGACAPTPIAPPNCHSRLGGRDGKDRLSARSACSAA